MAVTSRLVGGAGLVAAGLLAAAVVGQLPALGAVPPARVVTPASAGQTLLCPGPAVAVGARSSDADGLSATGKPVRTSGTAGGAELSSVALGRGDVSGGAPARVLTGPAAGSGAGPIAGAQAETVAGGDAAGLAATACTAPVGEAWFAAGATTTGRSTVLVLTNPSPADARVALQVWTENGPVDLQGDGEILVPRHGRHALSLAAVAPSAGGIGLHLVSEGGRVGVSLEQRTVRGLESGGVDLVGATAAPARTQVLPGIRIATATAIAKAQREDGYADLQPVVRVLIPGRRAADVRIGVRAAGGAPAVVVGRRVEPGVVTDFPVSGLGDGVYTVTVTAAERLIAGARVSVIGDAGGSTTPAAAPAAEERDAAPGSDAGLVGGDGPVDAGSAASPPPPTGATSTARGIDLAWFGAARPLGDLAAIAVVAAPGPVLTVANGGPARTVRLSGATEQTVQVPAAGSVSVPVAPGVVAVRGGRGLTAAVSFQGPAAVAGYPVGPVDQAARSVRITR